MKGLFDGKIKYDDVTIIDFKKISLDELDKELQLLRRKFR